MAVNLSAGVKAKLTNAKLAQAGSSVTVPTPATATTPTAVTPVTPAPVVQSGNQPSNTQPTTVTPVEQVTTPTAKVDKVQPSVSPDFQDNSDKRLKEIQMNLDKYAKSNPEMFANPNIFKNSFSYNSRSAEQKGILDSFYQSQQNKVQQQQAQVQQQQAQQKMITDLQVMSVQDMVDKGLSQEQVTSLASYNPDKFAQYQKAKEDKIKLDTINGEVSKNPFADLIDRFKNQTFEVPQLQTMFDEKMKELEPQQTELNTKKGELTQVKDEMDNILNDTRKELEGSGASDSYIRALASKRMEEITPLYNAKLREYNILADDYQSKVKTAEQSMNFAKEQYSMGLQAQQQEMSTLGFAMQLMDYQTPQQKADAERNQFVKKTQFTEGDVTSNDPVIQQRGIKAGVDQLMSQYDGLIISTRDQLTQRIQNDMKSGKTYQQSLDSIMTDIKSKPGFSQYMNRKAGIDVMPKSLGTLSDGTSLYSVGNEIITEQQFKDRYNITSQQKSAILEQIQSERLANGQSQYDNYDIAKACLDSIGTEGGWCGSFVNGKFGEKLFADTIESKISATKDPERYSPVPIVGGAVVIDNGTKVGDINAGHVAIVTAVNGNNIDYVDSNGKAGKFKVGLNKGVGITDKMYFTKAPGRESPKPGVANTATKFSPGDISLFNSDKYNPQTDKDAARVAKYNEYLTYRNNVLAGENPDIKTLMSLSMGNKSLGSSDNKIYKDLGTVTSQLTSLIPKITEERKTSWGGDILKPIAGALANKNPRNTKAQEIKAGLQGVVPKIARGVFGEVGVLTDTDISNYIQTLPNIKQTADVQDVVALSILGTLQNSLDSAIRTDSATYDVSGLLPQYNDIKKQVDVLKAKITEGGATTNNAPKDISYGGLFGTPQNNSQAILQNLFRD